MKWLKIAGPMSNEWPVNFNPIRYFFGDGYTIQVRWCEWGGHEIHVEATKPIRSICMNILNGIGGEWWTNIDPLNQKAINLCLRCGFEFFCQRTVINSFDGEQVTMNIYRRVENV